MPIFKPEKPRLGKVQRLSQGHGAGNEQSHDLNSRVSVLTQVPNETMDQNLRVLSLSTVCCQRTV